MVKGLVATRPHFLRNGRKPLLWIGEYRIDVENDAPERIDSMLHNLANGELGLAHRRLAERGRSRPVSDFHDVKYYSECNSKQRSRAGRTAPHSANIRR